MAPRSRSTHAFVCEPVPSVCHKLALGLLQTPLCQGCSHAHTAGQQCAEVGGRYLADMLGMDDEA
eukprot:15162171-Alexandrium_andersonii.AAC.1